MNPIDAMLMRRRQPPVIQSSEIAECGLACITMVAAWHGHDVDLVGMRQRFSISGAGATLHQLVGIADQLGFATRAARVELDDLPQLRIPAILHWNLSHFVVLVEATPTGAIIHDPTSGRRFVSHADLDSAFTGIVLELEPSLSFKPVKARGAISLWSLWTRTRGIGGAAVKILFLSVALQATAFVAPLQLQLAIDEGVLGRDADLITVISVAFLMLLVIQVTIDVLRGWMLQVIGQVSTYQVVGLLVRHMLRLPTAWFMKRSVGDILSRLSSVSIIQDALTRGLASALIDGVFALAAGVFLVLYAPVLGIIVLGSLVVLAIVNVCLFPSLRRNMELRLMAVAREQT
ncbi:MAG: cysteine peptidase family C39 domain-containing protein, partial [Brevundimonas sp.]